MSYFSLFACLLITLKLPGGVVGYCW